MSTLWRLGWGLSIVLLLVTGALGLWNGSRELAGAHTALQRSVTIGVLVYGVLGILGGVLLATRRAAAVPLTVMWALVITYVAATAAHAYAGADATLAGAIAGGVGAGLIGLGVVSVARRATRPAPES